MIDVFIDSQLLTLLCELSFIDCRMAGELGVIDSLRVSDIESRIELLRLSLADSDSELVVVQPVLK